MAELTAELTKELEKLRKALQSGKGDIVPFVGLGLSSPPLPGWRELLAEMAALAPEGAQAAAHAALGEGRLRDAAAALEDPENRAGIERGLASNYAKPHEERPGAFKALVTLPLQHFVTTARDPWLKDAFQEKLGAVPRLFVPTDANALPDLSPQSGPLVLMLHGDADRPETCVLGEAGYKTLGKAPRSYATALKALVGGRKVLFIGCSPQDPDVAALLDEWAELFGADEAAGLGAPRHFFLGTGLSEPDKALLFKLRIRPIEIGAPGDAAALGQALAYLSGTAPPAGGLGLETTRASARPASAAAAAEKTATPSRALPRPDAAAAAPSKEKYDPLARVKSAELEGKLAAREADVARLEAELAALKQTSAHAAEAAQAQLAHAQQQAAEAKQLAEEVARQAREAQESQAQALESEVATLRSQLAASASAGRASGEAAERARQLEATVSQLENVRASLEEARARLQGEKQDLETRVRTAEAQLKKLEAEKAASPDAAKQTRALEEKLGALEKGRVALDAEVKKLRQAAQDARSEGEAVADRVRAETDAERKRVEAELAETIAKLRAEQSKPQPSASKVPLVLGILFLLIGLGAAGVAIFQPALLDPVRSAVGAAPPAAK